MLHMLIDGKTIAAKLNAETAKQVEALKKNGKTSTLGVVLVGNNSASTTYVHKKKQAAKKIGMGFKLYHFPEDITEKELLAAMEEIQAKREVTGLIIQIPLPEHLYTPTILNALHSELDVDCLTAENMGKLFLGSNIISPPTPSAVLSILEDLKIDLAGKNVTIIGVGALVGKPLAIMMMNARVSVSTCNSITKDIKEKCLNADIIVTGVGKKNILRGDMVREGTIVIDTGFVFENGKSSGDVNVEEVEKIASYVTPTPGGVGPITVAHLLRNVAICTEEQK